MFSSALTGREGGSSCRLGSYISYTISKAHIGAARYVAREVRMQPLLNRMEQVHKGINGGKGL